MKELAALDAVGSAELVRRGEVSAVELVEAAIARVEKLNPKLNAVVATRFDEALAAAAKVPREAPLAGVPFLLKDLTTEWAGVPLTAGSRFLSGKFTPDEDCELVRRWKKAGLVILGKTNTSEFGVRPGSEPALFGPTRNPWDPARSAGGSSGGSAAAVASGMTPAAHGNDGGGSLRIPASWCGVFGLNPTRARTPWGPRYGDFVGGLAREHALTRTVRDSAALLDAAAGAAPGDPYCAPSHEGTFLSESKKAPGRLRVAFTAMPGHADCVRAVEDAAKLCEELGHEVFETPAPGYLAETGERFQILAEAECAWQIDDWARRTKQKPEAGRFEPFTWARYEKGKSRSASDYLLAWQDLQLVARRAAKDFEEVDAWLTPTTTQPPLLLEQFGPPKDEVAGRLAFAPFLALTSATGQPSASVPLSRNSAGLPIGVHAVARFGDEGLLLRLCAQLEAARPWTAKPAISILGA